MSRYHQSGKQQPPALATACALALLLCLAPVSGPFAAEEKSEGGEEEPVKVAQAETGKKNEKSDADDYKASEEISEDLSVSYPIDI